MSGSAKEKILIAFRELALKRSFDDISVKDLVEMAGVGRSTFYDHFNDKTELLITSMDWMLDVLASCAIGKCTMMDVEELINHINENRDIGRVLLNSSGALYLTRELSARIAQKQGTSLIDSISLANSSFGVLKSWLSDELRVSEAEIAEWFYRGNGVPVHVG